MYFCCCSVLLYCCCCCSLVLMLFVIVCRMELLLLCFIASDSSVFFLLIQTRYVPLGSTVAFTASIYVSYRSYISYILGSNGHTRSQGGRQPAGAKPIYICRGSLMRGKSCRSTAGGDKKTKLHLLTGGTVNSEMIVLVRFEWHET